ncbi:WD40-repeat-containing domain protein [Boeremia exigua]|uniref:WD40-repeat-containing domain protein n=1 Tax=Boeremia exigua TaxID=749465 RepID=UPI001E8E34A0|nr:WD40-repeat-containing domain protein [Boeremia exigua]KAH6638272.1 WD40-repeat-containing domain protein [Boeremia exigua]
MASPPAALPHPDDGLHLAAPNNVTLSYAADAPPAPDAGTGPGAPASFSVLAAAATLATLSDSRPPTSHGDDAVSDDDDGGGISLADFSAPPPAPLLASTLSPGAIHMHAIMAQLQYDAVPPPASDMTSFHINNVHLPPPPSYLAHLSSSEPSLEPLPAWPEAYLSIKDKSQFVPITSFFHYLTPEKTTVPGLDLVQVPDTITRDDLQGDKYDFQGIDWSVRNTTRSSVRAKRRECEQERLSPSLRETRTQWTPPVPNTDNFFSFRRNTTSHRVYFPHFQLRNVLAATSRNDVLYAAGQKVMCTDAEGAPAKAVLDLSKKTAADGSITTIATLNDVLIAGAFEGEYAITDLSSTTDTPCTFGRTADFVSDTNSKIVNHLHLFESRTTYHPQGVLCSNDHHLRILDCATNTFIHNFEYSAAVNCSATSPNGRMRVVVGDFQETLITNAETGRPFETLKTHTDDAFACAWADDGIHVATAAQDSTIAVWDARYWNQPLAVLTSELSVPRALRFSPVGSGPRVLVAAEADDYVSIINAQTFESKQVFDFFGPLGGVTFTPDGQSLFIANGERRFGGIIELERTGWAERTARRASFDSDRDDLVSDWAPDHCLAAFDRNYSGDVERQRRGVDFSQLVV